MADFDDDPLDIVWRAVAPVFKPLRRFTRHAEIAAAMREYRARTGRDAESKAAFAEAGTFQSQLVRLFVAGNAAELGQLQRIATAAIGSCHANKYYLPADLVSDVVDALESHGFLGDAPEGEPPLDQLEGAFRHAKLSAVSSAFLVPVKVAAIEAVLGAYAGSVGRSLPFAALGRFERQAARAFALADQGEAAWLETELTAWLAQWAEDPESKRRFREPAAGVATIVEILEGRRRPQPMPPLRVRRAGQPVRLSTLDPTCRQDLLEAALAAVRPASEGSAATPPAPKPRRRGPVRSRVEPESQSTAPQAPPETSPPTQAAPSEPSGTLGQLVIVLGCPKCGASFGADAETVTLHCEYCGSLLAVSAPDRDEMFLEHAQVPEPPRILDVYVARAVALRKAELLDRYRDENGEVQAPDLVIEMELKAFESRLRRRVSVAEMHRVHVPYWHVAGKIVQGALGQWHRAAKVMRVRAFEVEHTVPGYDATRTNFRDRGLRLGRTRLHPLGVADVRELAAFIPWLPVPEQSYREVDKWCQRTLEPALDPVSKHGEFLLGRRYLVYRRWWLVRIEDEGSQWLLVDGVYGNIGGFLAPEEVTAILSELVADPLGSDEASFTHVHVIAPRCPECGVELRPDPRLVFVVCPNCHIGLEPRPDGIQVRRYHHAAGDDVDGSAEYLPFWRYRFSMQIDGARIGTLEEWAEAALPATPGDSPRPVGDSLWIPGLKLLGTLDGDMAWKALVEWIHTRPARVLPEKIPLGVGGRPWGARLRERDARGLARFVLAAAGGAAIAARLTSAQFRRGVVGPPLELREPTLVMVPVVAGTDGWELPGTGERFGRLLLEGGPRLDALRASVYQIGTSG